MDGLLFLLNLAGQTLGEKVAAQQAELDQLRRQVESLTRQLADREGTKPGPP